MEAYALMRAIDKWGPKFRERAIFIRSDSMVALGMAKKLSSPHPSLNYLASELVLSSGSLKCSASLTTTCTENGMNRQTGSAESAIVATHLDLKAWQESIWSGHRSGIQTASGCRLQTTFSSTFLCVENLAPGT